MQLEVGDRLDHVVARGAERGAHPRFVGDAEVGGLPGEERHRDVGRAAPAPGRGTAPSRARSYPTTSGIAGNGGLVGAPVQEFAVDPRVERHHADLRQRVGDGLVLRGEERVDRCVAQLVDGRRARGGEERRRPPTSAASASSVPAGAPLWRIAPATGRSGYAARRCAMHPEPADSPMSTMRSGSPPNAPTLARNQSTAARRSRSGEVRRHARRSRASPSAPSR